MYIKKYRTVDKHVALNYALHNLKDVSSYVKNLYNHSETYDMDPGAMSDLLTAIDTLFTIKNSIATKFKVKLTNGLGEFRAKPVKS